MGILFCRDYRAEYEKWIRKFAISVMISFIQTKQEFIHVETLVDIIL